MSDCDTCGSALCPDCAFERESGDLWTEEERDQLLADAAPEMLEALSDLLQLVDAADHYGLAPSDLNGTGARLLSARAAIAKARGQEGSNV